MDNARQLAQGPDGTVYAGSRSGRVYALPDANHDHKADRIITLEKGLNSPSGIVLRDGDLYIGAISTIYAIRDVAHHLKAGAPLETVYDGFPSARHHGWKYLDFTPDGRLVVPVGAPCNICDPKLPFAAIWALDLKTKKKTLIARGVRNSVGFDFRPGTDELWFTDNGRDLMGDHVPPEELNRVTKWGRHYGYPYFHGGDVRDPEYGKGRNPDDYVRPVLKMPAHFAPLGMTFYTGKQFPPDYRGDIFIAQHGSWNRSTPGGYRVIRVHMNGADVKGSSVFLDGFLDLSQGVKKYGRPADVMVANDGSLLVADDYGGVIYRITWTGSERSDARP